MLLGHSQLHRFFELIDRPWHLGLVAEKPTVLVADLSGAFSTVSSECKFGAAHFDADVIHPFDVLPEFLVGPPRSTTAGNAAPVSLHSDIAEIVHVGPDCELGSLANKRLLWLKAGGG